MPTFSKSNLDLRDFFAKILPDLANNLREVLKDTNIDDKIKAAKLPEDIFKNFKEKASLVLLSVMNNLTKDRVRVIIFKEHKKLNNVVKSLKKLSNKIVFSESIGVFFEKKKV